ncbi:MAG: EAL domain-containing protein [Hyphomonadaceae bacterium]|nr:EAL domain-containing protein [Hyphomonadaceae bacterium]
MFKRLSSELTLIYAALFGVVLLLIAGAVWVAVEANSRQAVRAEMTSSSAVFDRIWKLRADQLQQTAEVLARDFGFREAVATGDDETMLSALDNIQSRFSFDTAMIIRPDGSVISLDDELTGPADPTLLAAVTANPDASGVLTLGSTTYQAVSAPVRAPTLIGWVVFGQRLGGEQLGELEQLSAIPLSAHLYLKRAGQQWSALEDRPGSAIGIAGEELAARAIETNGDILINMPERNSIGGVKTLQVFAEGASSAGLLLEYSLTMNQAHYRDMLATIAVIGAIGLAALVLGSWFVSRRVTGPISGLRAAADQLTRGEVAAVAVKGRNEIAELAANFNVMSSEIAAREQRILHLARHDQETGLPNLRALHEALAGLRKIAPPGNIFGAIISINRFDQIRGAIGHGLFSRLIAEIAKRSLNSGEGLHVGRATTGTIAVVFTAQSREAAEATIRATAQAVSRPVTLDGDRVDVMVTAGLACDAEDAKAHLELLERAEVAVEQARAQRKITAWFDPAAYGDPATTLSLMSSMVHGLSSGELFLAHQPKLDLRTEKISSAEALLRWRHPQRGMIRPDAFIGMAEETGHIRPLTDWVIDRAIADQRIFQKAGHDVTLSVNVSGRLIANEQFAERALRQIRRSGARLCFEITETAVIDNPKLALDVMNELKQAGIGISIDDYGSGLSSLSYLRAIPAEELKIDKVFVENLGNGNSDAFLVKSTIDLAHSLGMKLTAEGVETADVLAILRAMGADMIQGYFVAKPLAVNDFLAFMQSPDAKATSAI